MSFLKKINGVRRSVMRGLTQNIGRTHYNNKQPGGAPLNSKRILIVRPNQRLGNLLLITPLIQEITATFPECKIDVFVKGKLAPILFENYKNVDRIIELPKKPFKHLFNYVKTWFSLRKYHYDVVINVAKNSSSGRLSTKLANADYKIFGDIDEAVSARYPDHEHMAKFPVYNFRNLLAQLGWPENDTAIPSLNLNLSDKETAKGKKVLQELIKNDKKTISIFTYATGEKCYSEEWWETFYTKLQEEYKDYNIIEILPVENISNIGFKAPSFYSKDVREIGAVIANTDLFIGADSGIMHLASAVHTPTVGLFSVTDPNKYEPYANNSLAIDTSCSRVDEYIKIISALLARAKWPVIAQSVAAGIELL